MDRNVRALTIALLCVLAVSLAAATLANPQQTPGAGAGAGGSRVDDGGTAQQEGTSSDGGLDNPEPKDGEGMIRIQPMCVPFLTSPLFFISVIIVVVGVCYIGWRRNQLAPAIASLFVSATVLLAPWLMFTGCGTESQNDPTGGILRPLASGPADGGSAGGAAGSQSVFSLPVVLAGLFVVALLLAAVVYYANSDDEPVEDTPEEPAPSDAPDEETLTAIGDVAGEAADRIEESVDVENEVYRAWHEMTTHLDVGNPQASTPTEFAAAARDAGMSETHVEALTELFQDTRYGGVGVTEERETRAVESLRAIEDALAER